MCIGVCVCACGACCVWWFVVRRVFFSSSSFIDNTTTNYNGVRCTRDVGVSERVCMLMYPKVSRSVCVCVCTRCGTLTRFLKKGIFFFFLPKNTNLLKQINLIS